MSGFKKATKKQSKLRAAFFGPSGAGKTYTSLSVSEGLLSDAEKLSGNNRIGVIDTEMAASKYADRFDFDVLELEDLSISGFTKAIRMAAEAGYPVLNIDSLTHAWQQLLQEVGRLANAKFRGNTWSAWSEGTPLQRQLIDAILSYPGHVIATMRSKTEWQTSQDGNGKSRPVRVGLAPEQGKGVEYEFDLLLEISTDHIANVIKDRTGKFQDQLIEKPGREFGKALAEWLSDGAPAPEKKADPTPPTADDTAMRKAVAAIDMADNEADLKRFASAVHTRQDNGFYTSQQAQELYDLLDARMDALRKEVVA